MPDEFARKVWIVGIGDDGDASLTDEARRRLQEAELIFGTPQSLALLSNVRAERFLVGADLGDVLKRIQAELGTRRMVVLATGDPLFYGVARYLCDRLGKESFEVIPHVSTMQLAFARIKESWEDAYLADLSRLPLPAIIDHLRTAEKAGLFTSEQYTPAVLAKTLLAQGIDYFLVHVCENLGSRNEVVTHGSLAEIAEMDFASLNVMILTRIPQKPNVPRTGALRLFGNPDDMFRQSRPKRGLLTPAEVRVLALSELNVRPDSIVWDIGAGSGALSIEAARLAPSGRVFAIEPDWEDCELIRQNAATFQVANVETVMGRAPAAFQTLPPPHSVFLGGLGREMTGILGPAFAQLRPGGAIVANVASLENVAAATNILKSLDPNVSLLLVNFSRGVHQLETYRFEAVAPSFLIAASKRA